MPCHCHFKIRDQFSSLFMLGKSDQFLKYKHGVGDLQKIPCDYMSIMHYGKDYFAKLDASKRHYLTTIEH